MAKTKRQVIKIDEELCNGCGLCVPACAEGAIQIVDGKARLVSDKYCDGLGACLGECPKGAISFEEREADEFDEAAVVQHLDMIKVVPSDQGHLACGCPSAKTLDFRCEDRETSDDSILPKLPSELRQWPVKIFLVNPNAPYFQDADLLIAADCTAFAYASLHPDFIKDKAVVIGCPKFDDVQVYLQKLTAIFSGNNIKSITVLYMEVPCCFGLMQATRQAAEATGKNIPIQAKVVTLRGGIEEPSGAATLF